MTPLEDGEIGPGIWQSGAGEPLATVVPHTSDPASADTPAVMSAAHHREDPVNRSPWKKLQRARSSMAAHQPMMPASSQPIGVQPTYALATLEQERGSPAAGGLAMRLLTVRQLLHRPDGLQQHHVCGDWEWRL